MFKKLLAYFQYFLPQHLLSQIAGAAANSHVPWFKNWLIKQFIKTYHVSLAEAVTEDPEAYETFNHFFIRKLKPELRPIDATPNSIVCPVDGTLAQVGVIQQKQLLQAKNFYFDLDTLLGGDVTLAENFYDGEFITLYLAPHNYHRVHMPIDGKLINTTYVPGKLFSVNRITSQIVPQLYSRNERLICHFDTARGPMVVILVGAMIVGSIQMSWMKTPSRSNRIIRESFSPEMEFKKGDELGYFKLGSTVIVLFGKNKIQWLPSLTSGSITVTGQIINTI